MFIILFIISVYNFYFDAVCLAVTLPPRVSYASHLLLCSSMSALSQNMLCVLLHIHVSM